MGSLWQEFRHALRFIRKDPGFTAVVVLILALGIGANAAVYSIVDIVVLQPLPGKNPHTLVRVYTTEEKGGGQQGALSYPMFKEYRENLSSLSGIAAYRSVSLQVSQGNDVAQRVSGAIASGNFFEVLEIAPLCGRFFSASDDAVGSPSPVAVLSERYWKQQFDGRLDVIGSKLRINSQSFEIIGVAPSSLQEFERGAQIWLPMSTAFRAEPMLATQIDRVGNDFFKAVGRLKPGISLEQARAELEIVAEHGSAGQTFHLWEGMEGELINPSVGSADAKAYPEQFDWKKPWGAVASAQKGFTPEEGRLSWLLLGLAALVLVIATADVAGLVLARSGQEEKERAIRASLGATRWALLRLQVVRGMLLAVLGSVAGLLMAFWTGKLLFASAPEGLPLPVGIASSVLNLRVAAFVLGISFLTGIGISILPALQRKHAEISEALKQQPSGLQFTSSRSSRLQITLVFGQIVASLVLLVAAGLLVQTMRNVARIDLGFDTDHVLSASLDLARHGYTKAQGLSLIRPLFEKVQSIPAARSAALQAGSPVAGKPQPRSAKSQPPACMNFPMRIVSPGYFQTLQVPFLRGRDFTFADEKNSAGVVIINRAAANLCWPEQDPIGKTLSGIATIGKPFEIIGIVGNTGGEESNENAHAQIYTSLAQFYDAFPWQFSISILVRTGLPPHALLPALNAGIHSLDANLSLYDVQTPRELLAFVLAITGLYGLLAYITARRTREFGIRMALGASPRRILRLVFQEGGLLTAAGVFAGLLAALGATRLLQGVLFGVSSADARVLFAVGLLFLVTGLLASFVPARRAMRVDPMIALREE